jgi:signal transduction histidine kinase
MRLYEIAQAAIRHRDEVLARVAHDLRNPLNAIELAAASTGHAEIVLRATRRMRRLIDDLVDLAALQSERLTINARPERAEDLVRDALEFHRPLVEPNRITISSQVEPELPPVSCDQVRVMQVLGNLIGNAAKVSAPGGSIEIAAARAGDEIRFSVTDRGPGIPAEDLGGLFEPYFRPAGTAYKGTGLGLAIVRGIVKAHGGRVWAESELRKGSTFFFTLPIARPPGA